MLEAPKVPSKQESLKKPEDEAERLRVEVESILGGFQKDQNAAELFGKLQKIKEKNPAAAFENAWQMEQVDALLDIFENDKLLLDITHPTYFEEFQGLLCMGSPSRVEKPEREENDAFRVEYKSNPLNDRICSSLINRMYKSRNEGMSDFLLAFCSRLGYPLFPEDPEADDTFSQDLFGAGYIIDGWMNTYKKNPDDLSKALKILKGARHFLSHGPALDYGSFMESGADQLVGMIENSDNYFVNEGIQVLFDKEPLADAPLEWKKELLELHIPGYEETNSREILQDFKFYLYNGSLFYENACRYENRHKLLKYDEPSLRENISIEPLLENKDFSAYSQMSENQFVIYDYNGQVDSFFEVFDDVPQRLTLEEILQREGFHKERMSPSRYGTLLHNYKAMIELPLREKIEEDFKTQLKYFSIREQIQFLDFLSTKKTDQIESLKKTIVESSENSRSNKVKSFLSLELDQNNGDRIIGISQKLSPSEADLVFLKIAEIIKQTEVDIKNIIGLGSVEVDEDAVRLKLLQRAHEIILKFSGSDDNNISKLLSDLENSQTEIILLSALLKTAKENKEPIDFETIKNLKLERRVIGEKDENGEEIRLSEEEKAEMLAMVEKNYREVVFPDNPQAAAGVIADFKKELEEGFIGQMVYTLKFQGKLAAFARFEKLNDEEVYAGSLNVHQEVNNLCLGKYFTDSILPEVARQFRIKAITRADNPLAVRKDPEAPSFYENQGFVIDREHPFEKYGEKYYNMIMEKEAGNL